MTEDNINYFKEKLEELPDKVRWSIQAVDYLKEIDVIKNKYKLHIDQAAILEHVCQLFVLGEIDASEFIDHMFNDGHISSQISADILLDIDTQILKKIREKIEAFESAETEIEKKRVEYMDDEEKEIAEINTLYQEQDNDYIKVNKEIEQELAAEGFAPDGSNITEEDIARAYGISPAEYLARGQKGGIQEARESTGDASILNKNTLTEKEDLLRELETPQKSFVKPLFNRPAPKKEVVVETPVVAPDHQLQNTHIEEPLQIEDIITEEPKIEELKIEVTPTPEPRPKTNLEPIIKKPAKIDLGHDVYREPIE